MNIRSLGFYFLVLGFLDMGKTNIYFKRMFTSNVHITTNKHNNFDISKYDFYFERGLKNHRNELIQVLRICNRAADNMHFINLYYSMSFFFNLFIFSFPQQFTLERSVSKSHLLKLNFRFHLFKGRRL